MRLFFVYAGSLDKLNLLFISYFHHRDLHYMYISCSRWARMGPCMYVVCGPIPEGNYKCIYVYE